MWSVKPKAIIKEHTINSAVYTNLSTTCPKRFQSLFIRRLMQLLNQSANILSELIILNHSQWFDMSTVSLSFSYLYRPTGKC